MTLTVRGPVLFSTEETLVAVLADGALLVPSPLRCCSALLLIVQGCRQDTVGLSSVLSLPPGIPAVATTEMTSRKESRRSSGCYLGLVAGGVEGDPEGLCGFEGLNEHLLNDFFDRELRDRRNASGSTYSQSLALVLKPQLFY